MGDDGKRRRLWYLFSAAAALPGCVALYQQTEDVFTAKYYLDSFLKGLPTIQTGSVQSFLLPGDWCLFCIILLCLNGKTAKDFVMGIGLQRLVRMKDANLMWRRKWLECIVCVCLYFLAAYTAIGIFCVTIGQAQSFFNMLQSRQMIIWFYIPLLAACVIAVWQLVLSMKTNALIGLLAGICLLTISAYCSKWYLPGNYLMKLRVKEFLEGGMRVEYIVCGLLLTLAAGIILGKHIIRNMDYIQVKGDF